MAGWKVSAERVKIFPHPNADNLVIGKVGMFQIALRKGSYNDGDLIVFAPKRSIIPDCIRNDYLTQTGASYLVPVNDIPCRVSSFPMRGVESEGVSVSDEYVAQCLGHPESSLAELVAGGHLVIGEDISDILNITEYKVPIPEALSGKIIRIDPGHIRKHDVESGLIYGSEFQEGEEVEGYEKLHGSQIVMIQTVDNNFYVSSKQLLDSDFALIEDENNLYWRAVRSHNSFITHFLEEKLKGHRVQLWGEVIPAQKGYNYGQTSPVYRLFRMEVDLEPLSKKQIKERYPELIPFMAPCLYTGPYNEAILREKANQKEQVSGKELHNSEGIVVEPVTPRRSVEGFALYVKFLNKKYKSSDDDIS